MIKVLHTTRDQVVFSDGVQVIYSGGILGMLPGEDTAGAQLFNKMSRQHQRAFAQYMVNAGPKCGKDLRSDYMIHVFTSLCLLNLKTSGGHQHGTNEKTSPGLGTCGQRSG